MVVYQRLNLERASLLIDRRVDARDLSSELAVGISLNRHGNHLAILHPGGHLLRHSETHSHRVDIDDYHYRGLNLEVLPLSDRALLDLPCKRRANDRITNLLLSQRSSCP